MKNIIFAFVILLAGCTATKNTSIQKSNSIEKDFMTYLEAIASKDFASGMEYLVPEFFDIFPKADMIKVMEETFNNPLMTFNVKNPVITDVSKIETLDDKFYSKMTYTQLLELSMGEEGEESAREKEVRIAEEKRFFNQSFGEDNVEYNEDTGFFLVKTKEDAIAVSKDGKSDWKFLVVQEKQMGILKELIPEDILKRFELL